MHLKWFCSCVFLISISASALAVDGSGTSIAMSRLFWQQDDDRTVRWSDYVRETNSKAESLLPSSLVSGWPAIDSTRQSLVQMASSGSYVVVGVRDDDNGNFGSGWILIDTGVDQELHGDHSHWQYNRKPRVISSLIDTQQGNPAHLYVYRDVFFIANDKKDGFTRIDCRGLAATCTHDEVLRQTRFYSGGGGHITLAVDENNIAYSTWADREGSNLGRVDIVRLESKGDSVKFGSMFLASGGLHGATYCNNHIFFAPSEGVSCIKRVDESTNDSNLSSIAIENFALGTQDGKPLRTGAFKVVQKRVLFTTGSGNMARLGSIDTRLRPMIPTLFDMKLEEDEKASSLEIVRPHGMGPMGFVIVSKSKSPDESRKLVTIELDPNKDDQWNDSKIVSVMDVGSAKVDGHGGTHGIAFDGGKRHLFYTAPATGELVILDLPKLDNPQRYSVSGTPSKLIAIGGVDTND